MENLSRDSSFKTILSLIALSYLRRFSKNITIYKFSEKIARLVSKKIGLEKLAKN